MNKFKKYMVKNKLNARRMSARLDVSLDSVYAWMRGRSAPTVKTAIKIEKLTKGAVSVYDWN